MTALGLNNYGKQVYRHGLEDIDVDENGEEIFRESDSTFFCRVRDLFDNELREMYNTLESKNAWHAESFINQADAWQGEFPEELWRIDIERKYIRSYNSSFVNGEGDAQFLKNMCNGRMKYHRRQWERAQEKYMASKYQSTVAAADNAVLRCAVPSGDLVVAPNYKLKLTPYDYMYLNVKYGTQSPIQIRVTTPGVEQEIPFEGNSADIISIYSSSIIQSFGDLSSCYPATVDTSKASKIKELIIGNSTEGYDNPYFTTLTLGANDLLELINVENVSGLTQTLDLSALHNLRELYASGSNTGGVIMAPGGKVEIVELPAVSSITMKNLMYLANLDIVSLDKLTKLVAENCNSVDLFSIVNSSKNLNRVRITGVDWRLEDTDLLERIYYMYGIDKDGYNTGTSVLAGTVHVPIIRQQRLYEYNERWPDLVISYGEMIEQHPVTFLNHDGSVIEIQYVDVGELPTDPATREDNRIIPTRDSSVSHDFTFLKWDAVFTNVFEAKYYTAIYSQSLREYTIKYVSEGDVLQESRGLYGENVLFEGDTPVYTKLESAFTYYLFKKWDKSGFVDGDKTVNAVFDIFKYTGTEFDNKKLYEMTPVEIYALTKLSAAKKVSIEDVVGIYDEMQFNLGNDIDYDDIESHEIVSERVAFTGNNHIDTGIKLFDEDKDFVIAIDYEMLDGNPNNAVIAQCYRSSTALGQNGFKLWNSVVGNTHMSKMTWGSSSENVASPGNREIVIIRHTKGDNNIMIYNSNLSGSDVKITQLVHNSETKNDETFVLGCAKIGGDYENHAICDIHWCKIWDKDLGERACIDLAAWIHEPVRMNVFGFKKYYLPDSTERCSFSAVAANLVGRRVIWGSSNTGGWGGSFLNEYLNNRLFNGLPVQIRSIIKKVSVVSSAGGISNNLVSANCYITVPSCAEIAGGGVGSGESFVTKDPYISEGEPIPWMYDQSTRVRAGYDGVARSYWLRSPNASYAYVYHVDANGKMQGYDMPTNMHAILIILSF